MLISHAVPVTIRNPDRPIGTHVFTAVAANNAGLRWTVVTIDHGDGAKDALDRITIPQDVLDRIAPTASPRSSIIISDEPLSSETNYRTEFVAVLSNQPQGGFITRRPTPDVVASDDGWSDDGFGFFPQGNSYLATRLYAPARRPVLSADATALVVRRWDAELGRGRESQRCSVGSNCPQCSSAASARKRRAR